MASNYLQLQTSAKKILAFKQKNVMEILKLDPNIADYVAEELVNKMIDEIALDLTGEFHRANKLGYGDYICDQSDYGTENSNSSSNQHLFEEDEKKSENIKCPNCPRSINASRFAPHLETCMRMGRNSSRIASRRIASNSKENSYGGMASDDDDDEDCGSISDKIKGSKKLKPKKKKEKPRKQKSLKSVKEIPSETEGGHSSASLLNMSTEERVAYLSTICAVKNEATGKLCIRSIRCSQHNDEDRALFRKLLPVDSGTSENYVDIEEVELQTSKNETEHSSTSSPADSTSTSSSSSTKRREKHKLKNIKAKSSDVICPE
ncbi:hypothetical protein AAG570_008099 [Ranatra chinensis]|uniref:SCA7 domain-containing protein n=1 Tax=Ranatra chinensis TaxID=642074 RepID=A0ABD0XTS8_9HEMI